MTSNGAKLDSVDLLVIGAGMAGATAAARAVQKGASVVVVDKAPAIGGSAVYAGFVWTAPTIEVMRRENPGADPALGARLVEGFEPALEWVRSLGVEVGDAVSVLGFGRGYPVDVAGLMMRCERIVRESEESALLTKSTVERLLVEDGAVVGAEVVDGAGEPPGDQGCPHAAGQRRLRRGSRSASTADPSTGA